MQLRKEIIRTTIAHQDHILDVSNLLFAYHKLKIKD